MQSIKVVDLGTGLGQALRVFRYKGAAKLADPDISYFRPADFIGMDFDSRYASDIVKQGYSFKQLPRDSFGWYGDLPESDYYLCWNLLSKLNPKHQLPLIQAMLHRARRGVWIRLTSFEADDVTGEGVLAKLGLRFAWTQHPEQLTPFTLQEFAQVLEDYKVATGRDSLSLDVSAGRRVRDTGYAEVLPTSAVVTATKYEVNQGHKPQVKFDPPLVSHWDLVIRM